MVILDISAVNVALPDMAGDLGIGGGDIGWTITSYSLVFGSLLLLGGRAADLLGRRRVFLAGLTCSPPPRSPRRSPATRRRCSPPAPARASAPRCSRPPRCRSSPPPSRARARQRARRLGRRRRRRRRDRRAARRRADRAGRLARDLPHQPPRRARARRRRAHAVPADTARPRWRGLDLRGALARDREPRRARLRDLAGRSTGWTSRRRSASAPPRSPAWPPSPRSSCAPRSRCCASSASPTARSAAAS